MLKNGTWVSVSLLFILTVYSATANSISFGQIFGSSKESKESNKAIDSKDSIDSKNSKGSNDAKESQGSNSKAITSKETTSQEAASKDTKKNTQNTQDDSLQKSIANDLEKMNSSTSQNSSKAQIEKQNAVTHLILAAKNYIKKHGKKAAFAEFSKKDGMFTKGESYIFAVNYNGTVLASDNSVGLGKNMLKMKDYEGKSVFLLQLHTAKAGGGWVNYRWINPVTAQIECKRSFIMPMEGYFIGTGYHFAPSQGGRCE